MSGDAPLVSALCLLQCEIRTVNKPTLETVEKTILESVKFLNVVLQEVRRENIECQSVFGMSYGKYVGLSAPYDECLSVLRAVKNELDARLAAVRGRLIVKYRKH